MNSFVTRLVGLVALVSFALFALPAAALGPDVREGNGRYFWEYEQPANHVEVLAAKDTVELESRGWTGEYIFGMSKGLMRSTLEPAIKPIFLLFTVPLDLVFLPFAAIGGFFR